MNHQRPFPITLICLIGFIGVLISIPLIFSPFVSMFGAWYPPYLALSVVVGFVSMLGLWKMRRWGLFLYTAAFFINQIILLKAGLWNPMGLALPLVVILIGFSTLPRMR
jgi:hypothetical protein